MEKIKVIAYKNLPASFNLSKIFVFFTCLHYWNAPEWLFWVFWVLFALIFVVQILKFKDQEFIDLEK